MSKHHRSVRMPTPADVDLRSETWRETEAGHDDAEERVRLRRAITREINDRELMIRETFDTIGMPVTRSGDATSTEDLRTILDRVERLPPHRGYGRAA